MNLFFLLFIYDGDDGEELERSWMIGFR